MNRRPLAQRVGRFRLLQELGRGGMGVVYRATDPASGRMVALKVLLAADHAGDQATRRFQKEAETARLIDHPNVVKVHELGWHEGKPYFTMDLVDGGSLERLRGSMRDPAWYARVMAGVARGLQAAHARGLAHRDVKPSNILMEGDVPRLTDFGLARELSSVGTRLTATGEVLAPPHYMAPEQARRGNFDPALGDQYSVGAVLYDLLAGRPPHDGDSALAVMMSLTTQAPPPLKRVAPGVPEPLVRIVEQAMSRSPQHRYADCEALADDLERYVAGKPVHATAPTIRRRAERALKGARRPMVLLGTACGVALLTLGTVATWDAVQTQRDEVDRELVAQGSLLALEQTIDAALEQGDVGAAMAALHAHAARHRGTRTAVDTVLRQAPRLMELAPERSLALLAEAYTDAPEGPDQDRVLAALASELEAHWDWVGLAALTTTQARRNPLRVDTMALAGPRDRVQLAMGDVVGAAATLEAMGDAAGARLAGAVGTTAPAPKGLVSQPPMDWDGDGRSDMVARLNDRIQIRALGPGLPVVAELMMPAAEALERLFLLPDRRLLHWADGVLRLIDANGPTQRVVAEQESSVALSAAATDLDGDGTDEVYVGVGPYERLLRVVDLQKPQLGFQDAHPATTAAGSDVNALLAVEADGRPHLWAAVGPWHAYDVRRFGHGEGGLELLERRRLGHVSQLAQLRDGRVAALHSQEYGSRVSMDPETPFGPVAGVYVMGAGTTEVVDVLPWRGPTVRLTAFHEADLNGDGLLDWLISAQGHAEPALVVHLATDDGFREPFVLAGFEALAADQLDDDPADEVVVRDGRAEAGTVHILGAGTARPMPEPPPMVPSQPPPSGLDAAGGAAWQRAEDLVAMGLYAPAAAAFTRLHDELPEALAPAALARSARLHEARGDRKAAADAWQRLVGRRQEARAAAVRLLRADHRFDEAASLGGPPAPTGDTHWDIVDAGRIADALTVFDPLAAQITGDGVAVEAVAGEPAVAGVRLSWTGDHLEMELQVDLASLEWGSGLTIGVDGWDDGMVALRSWGGGGMYRRVAECPGVPGASLSRPSPKVSLGETWTIRLDWFDGELLCEITAPDGETASGLHRGPGPAGDLDLSIRPAHHAPNAHALARATLRKWTVTTTQTIPTLSAVPPRDPSPSVVLGLRLQPDQAVSKLLDRMGPAAITPFRDAHAALHHSHPGDPATQRVYTVHAAPLLAQDPTGLAPTDRLAYAEVLARRGMAWLDLGELRSARADLQAADQLLSTTAAPDGQRGLLRVDVNLALAAAWVDHAPETARRYLRQALQLHPVPELAPDRVDRFPSLKSLGDTWR